MNTATSQAPRNALASETSPYLLQHAANPVDWYPWGPEALQRARESGKPILLSIGYSACHWCHVMAHESFEDAETAALMNELYVNIKVDREERPDLDKIYQTAQYLLNRRNGGWPLTIFLTHDDQIPFAGGTYFPKEPRWGMPGFTDLLRHVARIYRDKLPEIRAQNTAVLEALQQMQPAATGMHPAFTSAPLHAAREELAQLFDARLGGFSAAPKFPHSPMIERLLRHYAATRRAGDADEQALHMATFTLRRMVLGGIYDQLGGGFARYSVDAEWNIPHFEKMLYDNGSLLALYSEGWQLTHDELFHKAAVETADWAMREMQSPDGGYYSSLDADSEGHEGRFYVWTAEEVAALLDADEYTLFARHFGLDGPPNFEGRWHLHVIVPVEKLASEQAMSVDMVRDTINRARAKLLAARNARGWPGCDKKVLTSWNALMIKGLAVAGRVLQRWDYVISAERAVDFIRQALWTGNKLLATYKDGRAHLNAYLDDHAYLIDALLALLQARWRTRDLEFAVQLAEALLRDFEDTDGGFFFTSHDHERLIQRSKTYADDAIPAGNGIAAHALNRLGHLLGEARYLDASERALMAAWPAIDQHPTAHLSMLLELEDRLQPPESVVIRGDDATALEQWRIAAQEQYNPRRMVFAIPSSAEGLSGLLAARMPRAQLTAYVCEGHTCSAPIDTLESLQLRLGHMQQAS
jgi:uncharacterized protein YyaL (SSP411 family)